MRCQVTLTHGSGCWGTKSQTTQHKYSPLPSPEATPIPPCVFWPSAAGITKTHRRSTTMSAPLEDFFAQFANLGFTYSKKNTAHNNFKRLREASQWDNNSTALTIARLDFNDALVQQFNFIYGTDSDLAAWQNLCAAIDILPIPDDIEECQRRVWDAHVNIVDLLESARTGERVRQFTTLDELRAYTMKRGKMFPKKNAYTGGLLKELLREIINEYFGKRRNGSAKRKRRKARRQAAAMQTALEEGIEA